MASYTYPVKHPEGTLTADQIQQILARPSVISKRLADITAMRFIADFILQDRLNAAGGGIYYETGEEIFAADAPEAVAPGGEYPRTVLTQGEIAGAKTTKWGLGTEFTDEKITREGIGYLNRGLSRLGNSLVKQVDSIAMAVIASKVTSTFATPAAWTTTGNVIRALTSIRGTRSDTGLGLDLDTVILKPAQYAQLIGMLVDDKALPREQGNIVVTGQLPIDALGYTWVTSPFYTATNPLLVDRDNLGGMADEKISSPGYVSAGLFGVESQSFRSPKNDKWEANARRVTVPVVLEPLAGVQLTGTGLA
jgi:hypothetical protein